MNLLLSYMSIKKLGVAKNYIGTFSTNADDNIDKTQKKSRYAILLEL